MRLNEVTAAAAYPIDLDQAREWLAFEHGVDEDDHIVVGLIQEVTAYLEHRMNGRKLITQTWSITLDECEVSDEITVPLLPLQSVSSVKTYDDDGNETTIDSGEYSATTGTQPRVWLNESGTWATDLRSRDAMVITCVVGYGDAASDIPLNIRLILKGLLSHFYQSKGSGLIQTVSGQLISIPHVIEKQIRGLRLQQWA